MAANIFERLLKLFETKADPEFIASQLRKPSGDFAKEIGKNMNRVNEPLYDLTAEVMKTEKNDHILEIGFGTGKFFRKLFSQRPDVKVSGVDYSREMVAEAQQNNPETISTGKLGNSNNLPYPDGSFDKVFCNMVIYFWDQPSEHLKEVHRILKKGGSFYTGLRSRNSMLVFPFVKHGFRLYGIEEWGSILHQNGFRLLNSQKRLDPRMEINGKSIQLESCCMAARKTNGERIPS